MISSGARARTSLGVPMHFLRKAAAFVALVASPAFAQAANDSREQAFAAFWQETCFDKRSDFDFVTSLAAANHWLPIDPRAAPFQVQNEDRKDIPGQVAWNTDDT